MKTEYEEVEYKFNGIDYCLNDPLGISYKEVSIQLPINTDISNMKILATVKVSETLKEFIEEKNITKKELLDWLNENYK
jgi:hypothetical protein